MNSDKYFEFGFIVLLILAALLYLVYAAANSSMPDPSEDKNKDDDKS